MTVHLHWMVSQAVWGVTEYMFWIRIQNRSYLYYSKTGRLNTSHPTDIYFVLSSCAYLWELGHLKVIERSEVISH